MTFGETKEDAIAQVEALIPEESKQRVKVEALFYEEPSYTGFVFPVDKYFPAWALDEKHDLVQAGLQARELIGLEPKPASKCHSAPMAFIGRESQHPLDRFRTWRRIDRSYSQR
jgi:hypothetical protein